MRDPAGVELLDRARAWVVDVYRLTRALPIEERYALTCQIRQGAVSVVASIATGQGRSTQGDLVHYLFAAAGSLAEVRELLLVTHELGLLMGQDLKETVTEAERMEMALIELAKRVPRRH